MVVMMMMVKMVVVVVIRDAADPEVGGTESKREGFVADDDGRENERFKFESVDS